MPFFTDAELFTCGTFAELIRGKDKKVGCDYIKKHYHDWFPQLPSYAVYNRKLNKFYEALIYIYKAIRRKYGVANQPLAMLDTAPIEVWQAQHSQKSKEAQPFVSKGYCAAKKKYYYRGKPANWHPARTFLTFCFRISSRYAQLVQFLCHFYFCVKMHRYECSI